MGPQFLLPRLSTFAAQSTIHAQAHILCGINVVYIYSSFVKLTAQHLHIWFDFHLVQMFSDKTDTYHPCCVEERSRCSPSCVVRPWDAELSKNKTGRRPVRLQPRVKLYTKVEGTQCQFSVLPLLPSRHTNMLGTTNHQHPVALRSVWCSPLRSPAPVMPGPQLNHWRNREWLEEEEEKEEEDETHVLLEKSVCPQLSVCAHVGVCTWLRAKALSSAFCNALPLSVSELHHLHNTALRTA